MTNKIGFTSAEPRFFFLFGAILLPGYNLFNGTCAKRLTQVLFQKICIPASREVSETFVYLTEN